MRGQDRNGSSDTLGGGGAIWRITRSTNLATRVMAGMDNSSLANADLMAELRHYRGAFEMGGIVRHLSVRRRRRHDRHTAAGVGHGRPLAARHPLHLLLVDLPDHRRVLRRPLRAASRDVSRLAPGGHDAHLRVRHRKLRRFDGRSGRNLGSNSVAATLQFRLSSLTLVATTLERQWRSNDTKLDRLTVVIA